VADEPEQELLGEFHEAILDILKVLNRSEVEDEAAPGLELEEIGQKLHARWGFSPDDPRIVAAVHVLMDHQLARRELAAQYAWTRGRILGERYSITTAGKSYLLKWIQQPGRIY
jgi:hypothetical protein